MVEDTNPSQDTVEISGHVTHQKFSYDKDVVEIKLPDTVDSDNYGDNFVKDVCVDEAALFHQKTSEVKPVDKNSSPDFSSQVIDAKGQMINNCRKSDDAKKSVHELKPEAVVTVEFAPDCNDEIQYTFDRVYDLGGSTTPTSDKKISLQELLRLESAEESRQAVTINSESSEEHESHEEAVGQASINEIHEVQAIEPKTSDHVSSGVSSMANTSGCSATISEDQDPGAALDVRKPNQIDRHNPFIDHRSLVVEDSPEPECSILAIKDTASTERMCTVDKTDKGLYEVRTVECMMDAASSINPNIQSSEKSNDDSENLASKAITGTVDETAVATSSSPNNAEPRDGNGENQEKCARDGVADVHDSNKIDGQNCVGTNDEASKSPTLVRDNCMVEPTAHESSKSTARIGYGDAYESNFFGPSIMSAPLSASGHIAYSGNISLRSDSSTTSTRSFAFPVLQREWISSPVRMAKAERRHARRRLGWRKGLICCKF